MKTTEDIWKTFSFTNKEQKSAFDYLLKFKEGLVTQTLGELTVQIDAVDSYIDGNPPRPAAIYKFFIVAPKLGNFSRKILTVVEYSNVGRFPVEIMNHFDDNKKESSNEENFVENIEKILTSPLVKNSIENLYQLSKQNSK